MTRRTALGGGLVGISAVSGPGEAPGQDLKEIDHFHGMYLMVNRRGGKDRVFYMQNVELRRLANRAFLYGNTINKLDVKSSRFDYLVWLAVDEIEAIRGFPTIEMLSEFIQVLKEQ